MVNVLNYIKNNRWTHYVGILLIGITLGLYILPSKTTIETVEVESQKDKQKIAELQGVIETQSKQLTELKKQINQSQTITQLPDGTIITQIDTQTTVDQTTNSQTSTIHKYEQQIAELEKELKEVKESKIEEINKKVATGMALIGVGSNKKTLNLMIQTNVVGKLGVVGGISYEWTQSNVAVSTIDSIVGMAGISYDL
jgi:TolA-binding protein